MKYNCLLIISLFFCFSCKTEARRPIKHSTTNFYKELIAQNKKLNNREKRFLKAFIQKDSTHNYIESSTGYWYYYETKNNKQIKTPKTGDVVTIEYMITDINDVILYPNQQKTYKVEKEDFIPALQDGIKLMKQGETVIFVVPSYRAFGVVGDENKIGINQPIKSRVTLIKIINNNENE